MRSKLVIHVRLLISLNKRTLEFVEKILRH